MIDNETIRMCIHFCKMDGYALYIWPAYGVAALGLIGITFTTIRALRKKRREAASLDA
jgi:heme exporter protein CcmD